MNPSKDLGVNSDLVYSVNEKWIRFKDLWLEEISKESLPFSNWDIYDLRGYENLEAKWVAKTPDSAFRESLTLEELQLSNEELSERYPDWMNEVSNMCSDCSGEKYMYLKEAEREDFRLLIRGIKPVPLTVDLKLAVYVAFPVIVEVPLLIAFIVLFSTLAILLFELKYYLLCYLKILI